MLIGKDLKDQRLSLGLTQDGIAKLANVSRQTIISLEQKERLPFTKLLDAYGLAVFPIDGTGESIEVLKLKIVERIRSELGSNCKVSIRVELCGSKENGR